MRDSRLDAKSIMAPAEGWTAPPKPSNSRCGCGASIEPVFHSPLWFGGRLRASSGRWEVLARCAPCQAIYDAEEQARERAAEQVERARLVGTHIHGCGISKVHHRMELANWNGVSDTTRANILGWIEGKHGLYIHGTPGTGKTHGAVGALKEWMRITGQPGVFRIVPELAIHLRQAAKRHDEDDLLGALSGAGALVLDDLGSERITGFVSESLYILIDRLWREERRGLIITSNYSLGEMVDRIGERLVSRIAGICKTVKLEGPDKRLEGRPL